MRLEREEGFTLIEALVSMAIATSTAIVVLTMLIASERSVTRLLSTHQAVQDSNAAAQAFATQAAQADYEYVVAEGSGYRFPYGGQCAEWERQGSGLRYRTWAQGSVPGAYLSLIEGGVTGFSMSVEGSLVRMALTVKPNDRTPTVSTERAVASTFVAPLATFPPRPDPCAP